MLSWIECLIILSTLLLQESTQPEIHRCNLASVVLQLMSLHIHDVLNFDYMDPPPTAALEAALKQLHSLGVSHVLFIHY